MNKTDPKLNKLFEETAYWSLVDENTFQSENPDKGDNRVTAERLAQDHSLLPKVLRALIDRGYAGRPHVACTDGCHAYLTRSIMHKGLMHITDALGNAHQVAGVSRIFQPVDADNIRLSLISVETEDVLIEGAPVTLVTKDNWLDMEMPKAYLETQFPGWEKRWKVGEELSMEEDVLLHHIFTNAPAPALQDSLPTFEL